jgi:hypothetical protein
MLREINLESNGPGASGRSRYAASGFNAMS